MTLEKMMAWALDAPGSLGKLYLAGLPVADLHPDEVLIQNYAVGLNPVDYKLIARGIPDWTYPHVPGVDGAGVVLKIGKEVSRLKPGDRVTYHQSSDRDGSFSTHVVLNADAAILIPDHMDFATAAAIPCAGITALQALARIPKLSDVKVLITAASGGVGGFLVQLAVRKGWHVTATASVSEHDRLVKLGVKKVVDYNRPDWIENLASQGLFDVVIDLVSGSQAATLAKLLGYYGHLVSVQDRVKESPLPPFTTCISLHEIALGSIHQYGTEKDWQKYHEAGEKLISLISNKELDPQLMVHRGIEKLPEVLMQMTTRHNHHKHVILL